MLHQGRPLDYSIRVLKRYQRQVQLVLQDPTGSLNPRHAVYQAVAERLRIHGMTEREPELVAQALARCGLRPPERFFLSYPHELSGGQRQRMVIAGLGAARMISRWQAPDRAAGFRRVRWCADRVAKASPGSPR